VVDVRSREGMSRRLTPRSDLSLSPDSQRLAERGRRWHVRWIAVAISVAEAFVNQSISATAIDSSPLGASQLFTIPASVPLVGGDTARLSGIGLFEQRPQVKLVANPANTVGMTASAIVFVTGTTNSSLPFTQISETWKVRLTGTAAVGAVMGKLLIHVRRRRFDPNHQLGRAGRCRPGSACPGQRQYPGRRLHSDLRARPRHAGRADRRA
jgi:hypothetical protein